MPRIISLFNHKGGVSKTTTTFNLGWALADRGHRVLLIDADPQCNLTGMILSFSGFKDFAKFYKKHPRANIYEAIKPAFAGSPEKLKPAPITASQRDNLMLLAGHLDVALFEPELSMAHRLTAAMPVLQNLPGAFGHLIRATAVENGCDIVLIDMSPSIGALNQNLLMQSDFFILPTSPDYFCLLAIDSLAKTLPRWAQTASELRSQQEGRSYLIPEHNPKFIGLISQKYRPRLGKPAAAFQEWIDQIVERVDEVLIPALEKHAMALSRSQLKKVIKASPHLELAQISDFNSLIARSQECATAVFALTEEQLKAQGSVLESFVDSRDRFQETFVELAERVDVLTA
ncbi:ParA family protein [Thiomonas delicata]|uniref:ATPase involved in chromosome partitioning n=1 Tax=Thiomonas delicata TaxID=364030 RepID=A0A238D7C5_THIDL|nr:ParA family protein [Thiomonas delicata]SBP89060.1 ATPase involved in chromosome partitioning [Thiomonas delicata]